VAGTHDVLASIEPTMQPWCWQTAEKALYWPAVAWVTTTLSAARITPPPTGMSDKGIRRAAFAAAVVPAAVDVVPPVVEEVLLHADAPPRARALRPSS